MVSIKETDEGTKLKAREAVSRITRGRGEIFHKLMLGYIQNVVRTAKDFCEAMGAVETGALKSSIRAVSGSYGNVGKSFEATRDITEEYYIVAGGPPYVNPKHKGFIDYASAVHDGYVTRLGYYVPARPFLSDALEWNKPELDKITDKYIDWIEKQWSEK